MKKVIIFGATGNTGIYFVDYCKNHINENEYTIIATGRKETSIFNSIGVNYINLDINKEEDYDKLPKSDVYAIVNFAGLLPAYSSNISNIDYAETNFVGSIKLMEYARKVEADRVLYMQTWAEMAGYWGKEELLKPTMERKLCYTGDHAFYSISKSATVEAMKYYHQEYGIKDFIFRLPNIYLYSPINEYYVDGIKKPIGYRYMIEKATKGEDIELWGDPYAFKDIVYVKDFCQMVYKSIFAEVDGGIYNVGTGIKTTLLEQIKGMIEVFSEDKKSNIIFKPDKKSFVSFVMDIENAKKELGYQPEYLYLDYLRDYKEERKQNRFKSLWEK